MTKKLRRVLIAAAVAAGVITATAGPAAALDVQLENGAVRA